jgi:5-methylcytosine-specific restriction endonuclease McrA
VPRRRTEPKLTKAKVRGTFVEHVYREVIWARANGRCGICGDKVALNGFEVDHIIPASKGGRHCYENVQPAHPNCNRSKADQMPWEYELRLSLKKRSRKGKKLRVSKKLKRKRKPWPGPNKI